MLTNLEFLLLSGFLVNIALTFYLLKTIRKNLFHSNEAVLEIFRFIKLQHKTNDIYFEAINELQNKGIKK